MWISSGINTLRASQARVSANQYADDVETLFEQDYSLEQEYHQLLNGKSNTSFIAAGNMTSGREMGSYDGPDSRHVLLLAATHGQHVGSMSSVPFGTDICH